MSFSNIFFHKKHSESVVFIDIGASSVAGAYAHYAEGEVPALLYTRRLPIELHKDEPHETAMLRALHVLGDALIREGAPTLMRATGRGDAGTILVSIDAPWQETRVRAEKFEQKDPFIFSKSIVARALKETYVAMPGKVLADESIIGTTLNGYETHNPYGKKVHRAAIVILTSLIDERIANGIATTLRNLYHTKNVLLIAGSSLRYQTLRAVFPHESDMLILDATGSLTSIALVRKNFLVTVNEMSPASGPPAESSDAVTPDAWIQRIKDELVEIAKDFPLPRTIFLLAQESEIASLQKSLEAAKLGGLWLSDNPLTIVPVLASHMNGSIRQVTATPPDLPLLLMTLFWHYRTPEEKP
ncbi:hypothetical protein A3A36_00175 [Candidatus Kaiserbacteria bacterium RIFCSPLOWO2_01_FULL_52_12b]|uniref:SHS2 domain-containing protein n=1 Tax=Candidatus Kaiserbacteria bacterium RIFCSPLOWO2_01_FULL_52_12b TaxID=1798509 RepID=A0A1F6EY67_9BACT|nr:MAG: hypothetical protein A3A36_00175 [Candidatus Kaiserbacteria bacterium RIFCSPLOWO2_01_FULL_52_12b]